MFIGEGLAHLKPHARKHRPGGTKTFQVPAGHGAAKMKLWHTNFRMTSSAFCAAVGPVLRKLPINRRVIALDNHPSHRISKTRAFFESIQTKCIWLPKHSPEFCPLDFSLWTTVQDRMQSTSPSGRESVKEFQKRLEKTARGLAPAVFRKCMESLVRRIRACHAAMGKRFYE